MVSVIIDNLQDGDVPHLTSATKDPHMPEERAGERSGRDGGYY
jgi:hypothetical protein